jgi:putative transposase
VLGAEGHSAGLLRLEAAPPSARQLRDAELKQAILALYGRSRDTYGARRITARLRIDRGIRIGQKRTARLMRELGIQGGSRGVRTTIPDRRSAAAPDYLGRDFTATGPDQKWVADITYIPTHEGWLFLAGVSDCYSRKLVGRSMQDSLEAELVADAIAMASPPPATRRRDPPLRQGAQYGSLLVGRSLRDAEIVPSMGRVGDPWDNALMESAIGTLKTELVRRHIFHTRDQARLAVFDYIETFYNPIRAHSALGYGLARACAGVGIHCDT